MLSGVEGKAAVGITSLAEAVTCLVAVSLFLLRGNVLDYRLLAPVLAGALLAVPFSAQIVSRVPDGVFKRVIAVMTISLGLVALLKALAS